MTRVFILGVVFIGVVRHSASEREWAVLCADLHSRSELQAPVIIEGIVSAPNDSFYWERVRLHSNSRRLPGMAGPVVIRMPWPGPYAFSHLRVRGSVKLRCLPALQNSGEPFRRRILAGRGQWLGFTPRPLELRSRVQEWLTQQLGAFPVLHALAQAIWTADKQFLPDSLGKTYRDWGLGHVLAVSGQHVFCLCFLLSLFLNGWIGFWIKSRGRLEWFPIHELQQLIPILASAFLLATSGGVPSVVRVFALCLGTWLMGCCGLWCTTLQRLGSSLALLILWDPSLLGSAGFGLSAVATFCLIHAVGDRRGRWVSQYLWVSATMPLLLAPMTAFYFGRLNVLSVVANILLGWVWTLFLIPFAFLVPVLASLPAGFVLDPLESAVQHFFHWHALSRRWEPWALYAVPQPTWYELILCEALLLAGLHRVKHWFGGTKGLESAAMRLPLPFKGGNFV